MWLDKFGSDLGMHIPHRLLSQPAVLFFMQILTSVLIFAEPIFEVIITHSLPIVVVIIRFLESIMVILLVETLQPMHIHRGEVRQLSFE